MERISGRSFRKLSIKFVREVTKPGRYSDGLNLYLVVKPNGKFWTFMYEFQGHQREMGLGPTHTRTITAARERAMALRNKLLDGVDPLAERQVARVTRKCPSFGEIAEECVRSKERGWKKAAQATAWRGSFVNYCKAISDIPIDRLARNDVLKVIEPIWETHTSTAQTLISRIRIVADYATARGLRSGENPADWRHLKVILSTPRPVEHRGAMPYIDVPQFVASFQGIASVATLPLEFLILTAVRIEEAMGARWDEIDFDTQTWTIPAARTKTGKTHAVPLSTRAIEILKVREAGRTNDFVFPGLSATGRVTKAGLWRLFEKIAPKGATLHGFRSSFRDWASEVAHCPAEVAEACLAHAKGGVEAAYHRTTMVERRRPYMQSWADYVAGRGGGNVVAIGSRSDPFVIGTKRA